MTATPIDVCATCEPPADFIGLSQRDPQRYWSLRGRCIVLADGRDVTRDATDIDEEQAIVITLAHNKNGENYFCQNDGADHARTVALRYDVVSVKETATT